MKKILSLALFAVLLTACGQKTGYKITGTVDNPDLNGKQVYLYEYGVTDAVPLAQATVENGSFTLEGTQDTPALRILRFSEDDVKPQRAASGENAPYTAVFILENGHLKATLDNSPTVGGTAENDELTRLQAGIRDIRSGMGELTDRMKSSDAAVAAEAEREYEKLDAQIAGKVKEYILANPDKQSSAKLFYDFRHSLDESTRRDIISKTGNTFKSTPYIDKMMDHLATLEKVGVGKKFTDLEMADPSGKMHKLSDYAGKGKVVLVDFWASWCPPCRRDMPHLVELYKQYRNKNFEIVGVSLDRTNDAWVKGIKDLNITWPQMSDLKYWQSEGAALYGVNSIPHTVLIDKDGTIIAKNLRGDALDSKLAEVIK